MDDGEFGEDLDEIGPTHVELAQGGYKSPQPLGLTKPELEEIILAFAKDPVLALRELLPHWYPLKMPWVHRGILALIREQSDFLLNFGTEYWKDETAEWTLADLLKIEKHFVHNGQKLFELVWDEEKTTVTAVNIAVSDNMVTVLPRGFSKTTLFKGDIILDIIQQNPDCKVQLYLSEAGPHAESQVNDIRMELQFNERIREIYGKQHPERQEPQKWTDKEFETITGMFLIARGRGGQVRGLNRASTRPGKILFDDLEDEESVSTPDQRRKVLRWFMGALERAGKLIGRTKKYGLGTILHHEALIPSLSKDPNWVVIEFGAIDIDGEALWEEALTLDEIEAMKISYASRGELSVFYREIMSKNVPDEDKEFRTDLIIHKILDRSEFVAVGMAVDPAISKKKGASLFAIGIVGMTEKGQLHVLEAWGKGGLDPRQQVDKIFELKIKWDCTHIGIETIAYQQALQFFVKEEMFRKMKIFGHKAYFEVAGILHQTDEAKHKRIEGVLQPRYASGYVSHQSVFPEYETALSDWPNSKLDIPDAVAMAVTLLQPYAGLASDEDQFAENGEPHTEEVGEFRHAP